MIFFRKVFRAIKNIIGPILGKVNEGDENKKTKKHRHR